ncbi:hypothetical protein BC829DRAFT_421734 [Chytridium lagenaria]|nr:hypothetical protein BC829DRAFT_421734 [Chytridium lagenaria]
MSFLSNQLFYPQGMQQPSFPTFNGTNERVFREELTRFVSILKLQGARVTDEAYITFIIENCFPEAKHVKSLVSDWRDAEVAASRQLTFKALCEFIQRTWEHTNTIASTDSFYELRRRFKEAPISNPCWDGLVTSFESLRSQMIVKKTDGELVIWILSTMDEMMRSAITEAIHRERHSSAVINGIKEQLRAVQGGFDDIATSSGGTVKAVSIAALADIAADKSSPLTLKEISSALREYLKDVRPVMGFQIDTDGSTGTTVKEDPAVVEAFGRSVPPPRVSFARHQPPTHAFQPIPKTPLVTAVDPRVDDLAKQFENLKIYIQSAIKPPKQPIVKAKVPPTTKKDIQTSGLLNSVDSLAVQAGPGIRCYYCGLPGHFKDQCEILTKDILGGAKVMIGPDRRLHWVVHDEETGARRLGEEVKGHRDGARHNVMEVADDTAYLAALAMVDLDIVIESYTLDVTAELVSLSSTIRCKSPPVQGGELAATAVETKTGPAATPSPQAPPGSPKYVLKPSDITPEEALRVVSSLSFGLVTDGIPVSMIVEEVLKVRGKDTVDGFVKRARDSKDEGNQIPRVAIDWPPKPGMAVVYPRKIDDSVRPTKSVNPAILPPAPSTRSSVGTLPLESGAEGNEDYGGSFVGCREKGDKELRDVGDEDVVGGKRIEGSPEKRRELGTEGLEFGGQEGEKKKRKKKKKERKEGSAVENGGENSLESEVAGQRGKQATVLTPKTPQASQPPPNPDYTVRRGVHLTNEELLHVIDRLFNQPVASSLTWGQFLGFSPRAVRMVMDRIKAKRFPLSGEENIGEGMDVDVGLSEAMGSKPDRSSDLFDTLLSTFLDEVDTDKLIKVQPTVNVESVESVDCCSFRVSADDVLDSFSADIADDVSEAETLAPEEARCKVVAASPSLYDVKLGLGKNTVVLNKVTIDGGSQVITVRLSVYKKIGASAGIEEGASINMRGAHGHTRKLVGLVPRLPVTIFGLTYFVQAFIIDDTVDPKPPFGLLLGQPFIDLARAETVWTEEGDQWTRFRSQQDRNVILKVKTVDSRDRDNQYSMSSFRQARADRPQAWSLYREDDQ